MAKRLLPVFILIAVGFGGHVAASAAPAGPSANQGTQDFTAQTKRRPHVVIRPRRLGPNARRICQAWLAQEYRLSGPVITPQMRCWWEQ